MLVGDAAQIDSDNARDDHNQRHDFQKIDRVRESDYTNHCYQCHTQTRSGGVDRAEGEVAHGTTEQSKAGEVEQSDSRTVPASVLAPLRSQLEAGGADNFTADG